MEENEPLLISKSKGRINMKMDETVDLDLIGEMWPLFPFTLLGFRKPSYIPTVLSWIHFLVLMMFQLWFVIWLIYYTSTKFNVAIGIVHGFDAIMFFFLWILVPYTFAKNSSNFVNTMTYLKSEKLRTFGVFRVAYLILLFFLLLLQLLYGSLVGIPFIQANISPILPWSSANTATYDTVILSIGMMLNIITVNSSLVYLAIAAHLQSFQINDFLNNQLLNKQLRLNHVKHILHLVVQSLRDGNSSMEPINAVITLGLTLEATAVATKAVVEKAWDDTTIVPFLLILLHVYCFLLPPAYITRCWDKVFHECLALHALAPTSEDEMGSIITYMQNSYAGYTISNVRIDFNKILYFTFLVVILLAIKVQQDVQIFIVY
eukprot:TRINITY_DN12305_c0_g1_i1.p1 TRINITY_DN12305_c0_g1~~TRINITY_DN12305_c0_g1_i1.p1  ORF type:complete len:376 (+),score=20.97 TRINITY_DN12305_c0_g1_i1:40-1167(+)